MAEKRQFLDVWIVETNTVYKEVPFTVVTDWVQQGRLLANDMLKPSGTKDWQRLGGLAEIMGLAAQYLEVQIGLCEVLTFDEKVGQA